MKHFRIPYSILSHEIMQAERQIELRLFLTIVGNACYKDGVQVAKTKVILQRGQWLRSQAKLRTDLGASPNSVARAVGWLVEKNLIQVEHIRLGTIFTVTSFNIYQGKEHYREDSAKDLPLSTGKREDSQHYREDSAQHYREDNNTNKEINTNKKDNIYPLSSSKNIKAGFYDERDTSTIEWEKYDWKF
jgi:hypothetical protein